MHLESSKVVELVDEETSPSLPKHLFYGLIILCLGIALYFRLHLLALRPLHNDEGVNFFFIQNIVEKGYYEYSHLNYHGPAYFYLTLLFYKLVGDSEQGLRASAVLCGCLTFLIPLLVRKREGDRYVVISIFLLSIATIHTYSSRYAIHETLFLLSSLAVGFSFFRWWLGGEVRWIYLGCVSLAVLIATKETFIISLFSIFIGALALALPEGLQQFVARVTTLKRQWYHLLIASVLICVLVLALFTGSFQWADGVNEMVAAIPQWMGRTDGAKGDTGHFKPFWYYTTLIWKFEPWLFAVFFFPVLYLILWPEKTTALIFGKSWAYIRFLTGWTLSAYLVYSFLNYKTPWLIINFSVPAALATAWWLAVLWKDGEFTHLVSVTFLGLVLGLGTHYNSYYNFVENVGEKNPLAYVHTRAGMLNFVNDLIAYRKTHPGARLLIGVDGYWPLPFYIRHFAKDAAYQVTIEPEVYADSYSVILAEKDSAWRDPKWVRRYYRLTDVSETHAYFKK